MLLWFYLCPVLRAVVFLFLGLKAGAAFAPAFAARRPGRPGGSERVGVLVGRAGGNEAFPGLGAVAHAGAVGSAHSDCAVCGAAGVGGLVESGGGGG